MKNKKQRKRTKLEEAQAIFEEFMEKSGNVYCPECSVPNWKVWHKPGEHTKKTDKKEMTNATDYCNISALYYVCRNLRCLWDSYL